MSTFRFSLCSGFLSAAILVVSPMQPASAATIYTTVLSGANEVPSSGSAALGSVTLTLDGNLLTVNEAFSGLTTPGAAAHIHCCSAIGVNAPVAVPFPGFPALTAGTYMQTFDLSLLGTYSGGFVNANGGTAASAEAAFLAGLNAGQTYANIHDMSFPGGEIRGQVAVTPEPATAGLLLFGLLPIIAKARKNRTRVA